MIRLLLLAGYCLLLVLLAPRDWFKSLCGLVLLMGVIEHPDMPRTIFGIQGLNPWNVVFACILLARLGSRASEGPDPPLPGLVKALLGSYLAVVLVATARMMADRSALVEATTAGIVSEYLVNTVKWVVPGMLFYYGCRSEERFRWAVFSLLGIYVVLAVQVIKWMPFSAISTGEELTRRSLKILINEIGYHRVNLSMMLAGASWAILASRVLLQRGLGTLFLTMTAFAVVFAQGLTGGRTGYGTWIVVGVVLGVLRWRRYLLLIPAMAILVLLVVPGVRERVSQGFSSSERDVRPSPRLPAAQGWVDTDEAVADVYLVTAGRNIAWTFVTAKIAEGPIFGFGREAMRRTGIAGILQSRFGEGFAHPHGAYLEILLDSGVAGLLCILPFFLVVLRRSVSLFLDSRRPEFVAAGGVCLALVTALLVASIGSQTFYPREGSVGMWCAIGLMLRVHVERARAGSSLPPGKSVFEAAP